MKLYTEEQIREVLSNMLLTAEQVESIIEGLSPQILDNTVEAQRALIRELRKGYIDMALIIEQLTTKDLTEDDIKDMRERADRLKESIK